MYQNRDKRNKDCVGANLKPISANYRTAVDAGKRSGGGRLVFTFYSLCEKVWGDVPVAKPLGVLMMKELRKTKQRKKVV